MLYQLPNGRTIYITIAQYLDMTDEDIKYMVEKSYGNVINNPFHDLDQNPSDEPEDQPLEIRPDEDEEDIHLDLDSLFDGDEPLI